MKRIIFIGSMGFIILLGCSYFFGITAKSKWNTVRGDLHCHSSYSSDSSTPLGQVMDAAKKAGMDFIFLTEHNTTNHLRKDHSDKELLVLPGYEWTMSGKAHFNVFRLRKFDENTSLVSKEEINKYISYYHNLGGRVQLNHPYDPTYSAKVGMDLDYNYLEIWNGKYNADDQKTMDWWQAALSKGQRLVATGGTDKHDASINRYPLNCLLVKDKTAEAIYDAMDKGHLYVAYSSQSPYLSLSSGNAIMGDTVQYRKGKAINIELSKVSPGSTLKVYTELGTEIVKTIDESNYKIKIPMEERVFYRIELWKNQNELELFSNPLYIRNGKE
jgi:predicted metal-dependent phosphoesterase TrpH